MSSAIGTFEAKSACSWVIFPPATNSSRILTGAGCKNLTATSRREILAMTLFLISISPAAFNPSPLAR